MHSSSPAFSRATLVAAAEDSICEHIHVLELSLADISARVRDAVREQRVQRLETVEEYEDLKAQLIQIIDRDGTDRSLSKDVIQRLKDKFNSYESRESQSQSRITELQSSLSASALEINRHTKTIKEQQQQHDELSRDLSAIKLSLHEKNDLEAKGRAHIDKLKEKLAAAASVDAAAKAQISDLEASIVQKNAALMALGKESDTLRSRLSESANEQKATKDQLLAASSQL